MRASGVKEVSSLADVSASAPVGALARFGALAKVGALAPELPRPVAARARVLTLVGTVGAGVNVESAFTCRAFIIMIFSPGWWAVASRANAGLARRGDTRRGVDRL